ncbi:CRS2-associated factor 2, mitochondrial-like [Salvia miltiorrhiza]|uniref:CRS2-associated factor 2, mitochondrial-like n=1 Tax=Salvia miltiorrhiza TaxID=226208 RepID=UPI0025ABCE38|nr:CRS2-associated factor 2, mitochondrial-like [Salvia miltiorrhiza]
MGNICFHLDFSRFQTLKNSDILLMLWKPYAPIYPKLVKNVADGLTFEETKEKRNRGLNSPPLVKLTRNGVNVNVVERVRTAFETDESLCLCLELLSEEKD